MAISATPVVYRSSIPPPDLIAYLKGDGNYTRVILLSGKELLFATTIWQMHRQHWPEFVRVHKSYAVNPKAVRGILTDPLAVEGTILGAGNRLVTPVKIPVARRRKPAVAQLARDISAFR